jgi:hypothetical protein
MAYPLGVVMTNRSHFQIHFFHAAKSRSTEDRLL